MKILLVITGLGVGGAERLVTNLADRYVELGHEVVLAYFQGDVGLRPSDSRVRLICLELDRSLLGLLYGSLRLRNLIKSFKPDVINSHMIHPNLICRVLRLSMPMKRLINSAHSNNEGGALRMILYRLTDGLADVFTNVSKGAVQSFVQKKAVRPGRMIPLLNGVDTQVFFHNKQARQEIRCELKIDVDQFVFLAVGRFHEAKDYPNLLNALKVLVDKGVSPLLLIAGDGPLRGKLDELIDRLNIGVYVRFLGVRHDIPALMSSCDAYLLSSAWEGFGLVVAEAMAVECVVIGTDCGGVKEVIGDEGVLVPAKEAIAFADAMQKVLEMSKQERSELGCQARARILENYSLDKTVECYLSTYSDALGIAE